MTVTNNFAPGSTTGAQNVILYLADRVTSAGANCYVLAQAEIPVPADNTAAPITKTFKWADLSLNGATSFDPTQILAVGLGFTQLSVPVNLSITGVTFSTAP
jgi:hypothetical protein